jgi:two-component system, LytTR family, response regulator
MIKALIVDDVSKSIVVLRRLLNEHCPEVNIIAEAEDVDEALRLIELHHPQLVFLDIQMQGKNGFDLLEESKDRNFHVIFVTAHSEFAIDAFRFSVTDYLLKPVNSDILKQAVQKVIKLVELSDAANNTESTFQTLRIPSIDGLAFVPFDDIIRMQADGHYTHIYTISGKHYLSSYNLQRFEEYLDHDLFLRTHRSHIINRKKIKSLIQSQGLIVQMIDGFRIEVPRRNKEDFLKLLQSKT